MSKAITVPKKDRLKVASILTDLSDSKDIFYFDSSGKVTKRKAGYAKLAEDYIVAGVPVTQKFKDRLIEFTKKSKAGSKAEREAKVQKIESGLKVLVHQDGPSKERIEDSLKKWFKSYQEVPLAKEYGDEFQRIKDYFPGSTAVDLKRIREVGTAQGLKVSQAESEEIAKYLLDVNPDLNLSEVNAAQVQLAIDSIKRMPEPPMGESPIAERLVDLSEQIESQIPYKETPFELVAEEERIQPRATGPPPSIDYISAKIYASGQEADNNRYDDLIEAMNNAGYPQQKQTRILDSLMKINDPETSELVLKSVMTERVANQQEPLIEANLQPEPNRSIKMDQIEILEKELPGLTLPQTEPEPILEPEQSTSVIGLSRQTNQPTERSIVMDQPEQMVGEEIASEVQPIVSEEAEVLAREPSEPIVSEPEPPSEISEQTTESGTDPMVQPAEQINVPLPYIERYHPESLRLFFGDPSYPDWDLVLMENIKKNEYSESTRVKIMDGVIEKYKNQIYVYKRKSTTEEELNEILQMQFCLERNLQTGTRFKTATVKLSDLNKLSSTAQKLSGSVHFSEQSNATVHRGEPTPTSASSSTQPLIQPSTESKPVVQTKSESDFIKSYDRIHSQDISFRGLRKRREPDDPYFYSTRLDSRHIRPFNNRSIAMDQIYD